MSVRAPAGNYILLVTVLVSGIAFMAGSAVTVALPAIQSYFRASLNVIQWVVNAYLLSLATLLLIGGSLGDHFGRKRVLMYGVGIFGLGAAASGLAATSSMLIVFQAVQGVGAALMIPQSLAMINAFFPESDRGRAIGLWAGLSGAVSTLGPWVGGWLVQSLSWRAVFFLNVPLCLISLGIAAVSIPGGQELVRRRLDWRGILLVFAGLLGLAYGLMSGPGDGWSQPLVMTGLIGGAAAILLFVFVERRQPEPLVPLQIFKNPLVAGANLATLFLYFALNGATLFVVLNLQQVQGYTPLMAGIALLPMIVLITFLSGPAGSLADRLGPRLQMVLGPAVVACGMALLIFAGTQADYFRDFLPGLVLFGTGMSLVIAPLTKSALLVHPELSGAASGVNNAVARVAALLAVAILGAVILSAFTGRLSEMLAALGLSGSEQGQMMAQADKLGAIQAPEAFGQDARRLSEEAVKASFVYGFRWVMAVNAFLALAASIVSAFTIHNPSRS